MSNFRNIKELLTGLYRGEKLLDELFKKRQTTAYKYEYALDLLDNDEKVILFLIEMEVVRKNGSRLEIDEEYLQFFERILEANEEINTSYIHENLEKIRENIGYYFNEDNAKRQYDYLRIIKSTLRKIGYITLRNLIDLKRNIDHTYKTEPNYKNKISKLKNLEKKAVNIKTLIHQTEELLKTDEATFFKNALDEELNQIIVELRTILNKCGHNLIEIERQVLTYLNQIEQQQDLIQKLRRIKYLKDQFLLEAETDIREVLARNNAVIFEPNPSYSIKLSLSYLQTDDLAFEIIQKVAKEKKRKQNLHLPEAESISNEFLETKIHEEIQLDLVEIKNSFLAGSRDLYSFLKNYKFPKEISFEEKITIFCQLVSQYDIEFNITDQFLENDEMELALIYPK